MDTLMGEPDWRWNLAAICFMIGRICDNGVSVNVNPRHPVKRNVYRSHGR